MPRIKTQNMYGFPLTMVVQENHSFSYLNTNGKRIPQSAIGLGCHRGEKGRILEITSISKDRKNASTVKLNGTQINTLKRVLQEAGEV